MLDVVDAAFFYPPRGHTYFFRGDRYIKYKPGFGVVPLNGQPTRRLGVDHEEWSGVSDCMEPRDRIARIENASH